MYKIVRCFLHRTLDHEGHLKTSQRTIKKGLTREEAEAHCSDPTTHMKGYAKGKDKYKGRYLNWFDAFEEIR